MEQQISCRFCLDSSTSKDNPLIDPCDCNGSIRYVHKKCLSRWRRMNPLRNANICLLCLSPYRLEMHDSIEIIPNPSRFFVFLLRYPYTLSFTTNYIFLLQYTFTRDVSYKTFQIYQYAYQVLYFVIFYFMWEVQNKRQYWRQWRQPTIACLVGFHILSNYFITQNDATAVLPLTVILSAYWHKHVLILQRLNEE